MSKFEKIIRFDPAFDKRHSDPSKNYGIHGVNITFILKNENKAVQFVLFTNWQLPHVTKEFVAKPMSAIELECLFTPMAADLGYHSPISHYVGQEPMSEECEYTDGVCYYDGSGLAAESVYNTLLEEGDEGVWHELEEYYKEIFN